MAHDSKVRLLQSALSVFRAKGYAATRVEDLCAAANLTKGSFFHHFRSKEDLAIQAAAYWSELTGGLFAQAPYHSLADPLDRFLGYLQFRKDLLRGPVAEFTCYAGTLVQEIYDTHPALRSACEQSISGHAAEVAKDIAAARERYTPQALWTAEGLALYTQAVLQGSFVLAKSRLGPEAALECVDHLIRYVRMLFAEGQRQGESL